MEMIENHKLREACFEKCETVRAVKIGSTASDRTIVLSINGHLFVLDRDTAKAVADSIRTELARPIGEAASPDAYFDLPFLTHCVIPVASLEELAASGCPWLQN